jgi:hypothetical protein
VSARGRRVRGLVEFQTRLPEYQGLVSYRAYRLKETEAVIDQKDTGRVNGILKSVKHHFSYYFGGEVPLKVLDFLSIVKEAMDLNHVSEGVAAVVLPYLLAGEAKDGVISMQKSSSLKVQKYPAAVAWLLKSYATDAAIDAAADKFFTAKQTLARGNTPFPSDYDGLPPKLEMSAKKKPWCPGTLPVCPRISPTRSVDKSRLG